MPELPEVETTVKGINSRVLNRTFVNLWTDSESIIKKPEFKEFEKEIKGKKILRAFRRGKNIIIELSGGYSMLIHQKMTGHLLYGKWKLKNGVWESEEEGFMRDPKNQFIRLMFFLDNEKMLALSDLRKFAKVELYKPGELEKSESFKKLGPEPLEEGFNFKKFKGIFQNKKGKIKQTLMDQELMVGVGNIYSDEALWQAKIHPLKETSKLTEEELEKLFQAIKDVLKKGIILGGESFADYRNIDGKKGEFDDERKAYKREGEKCYSCKTIIKRIKIGGRSACFCPSCQTL